MGKTFEGEILIRTLGTILLEIVCEMNLHFKVIVKSIKKIKTTISMFALILLISINGKMQQSREQVAKRGQMISWWVLSSCNTILHCSIRCHYDTK